MLQRTNILLFTLLYSKSKFYFCYISSQLFLSVWLLWFMPLAPSCTRVLAIANQLTWQEKTKLQWTSTELYIQNSVTKIFSHYYSESNAIILCWERKIKSDIYIYICVYGRKRITFHYHLPPGRTVLQAKINKQNYYVD